MKKTLTSAICLLVATIFIAVMPTDAEGAIYENTVRLHILANSDSTEDQALKLALRDEVLREYGRELSVFESVNEAKKNIEEKLDEIESFCNDKLDTLSGGAYSATVTITEEWYDTRDYGKYTLPKGYYTSLRIIIGEGEGANWWCVLFPPLCLDVATDTSPEDDALEVGLSREEYAIITGDSGGYRIKFKALELLEGAFGSRKR